jgi:Domain of unknown function (DUF4294)
MKNLIFILLFLTLNLFSQTVVQDTTKMGYTLTDEDSIIDGPIMLQEVVIVKEKLDPEAKKQYLILQKRVFNAYPYAKIASERLTLLNRNMALLQSNKEKKKYLKIVNNYLENEFSDNLKKLSSKTGQVLVKLIYRQTGNTTFDLIKDYKSGWKAFWSNQTAHLFNIDLKRKYEPFENNEDYLIENILYRAFNNGFLSKQEAKTPIDIDELNESWNKKLD